MQVVCQHNEKKNELTLTQGKQNLGQSNLSQGQAGIQVRFGALCASENVDHLFTLHCRMLTIYSPYHLALETKNTLQTWQK